MKAVEGRLWGSETQPLGKIASWLAITAIAVIIFYSSNVTLPAWLNPSHHSASSDENVSQVPELLTPKISRQPVGVVMVPASRPAGNDSSLAQTPQKLVLAATRPGRNNTEGYAALGTDALSPQTYRVGALLANGARLIEVYKDHIVLARGDQTASLYLQNRSAHDPSADEMALLTVGGQPQTAASIPTSDEVLTDYLKPTPVYVGTELKGFQVSPGIYSDVFSEMGLQTGDIITSIDGKKVQDAAAAITKLRTLTQGVALVATVERNGATKRISIDGSRIVSPQFN